MSTTTHTDQCFMCGQELTINKPYDKTRITYNSKAGFPKHLVGAEYVKGRKIYTQYFCSWGCVQELEDLAKDRAKLFSGD